MRFVILILLLSFLVSCNRTSPEIPATSLLESITDTLGTVYQTASPISTTTRTIETKTFPTPSPSSTPTLEPAATSTPSVTPTMGVESIIGVWRGTVTGVTEYAKYPPEERIFEISRNCRFSDLCLNILKSYRISRYAEIPMTEQKDLWGDYCFRIIGIQYYMACFTPLGDGSLKYSGGADLYAEDGVLQRVENGDARKLVEASISSCQTTLPSRLIPGNMAYVGFTNGKPLTMRGGPSAKFDKLLSIPEGNDLYVMNGPVCDGGYWWWLVDANGSSGWVAEGNDKEYFIEPGPPLQE
jgi:hypothetical protein